MFLLMFRSLPFSGSPSGKPGFSFRKPLPTGHSKISKCLKCAPVQAGTLPRGAKVSETHAQVAPSGQVSPPPRTPEIIYFPSRFLQRLKQLSGLPRWTLGGPLGVPMAPPSSQMAPKMLQNGHQNVSPKAPRTQNLECEQVILFSMFQTHFGPPKRLENVPFFFQNPALVALAAFWPPGCPQ